MAKLMVLALFAFGFVLAVGATSHGDVAPPQTAPPSLPPGPAAAEPITGTAVMPAPGSESVVKDPFQPYGIAAPGDTSSKPFWSYDDLTPAEQVVADAGRDTSAWPAINSAYNTAVIERAQQAAADAAQHQLGVDDLGTTGVVP